MSLYRLLPSKQHLRTPEAQPYTTHTHTHTHIYIAINQIITHAVIDYLYNYL